MSRVLVLRPEPGAAATCAAARARGLDPVAAPLFTVRPLAWTLPDVLPDAVLMTSANAARFGGAQLAALADLPLYAVGAATAAAARAAGFTRVIAGATDVAAIVAAAGGRTLLHLAGREHRPSGAATVRIVYASDAVDALPAPARAALPDAVALLHSARAAGLFAALIPDRAALSIAALSTAVARAAGRGWGQVSVAERPTDAALLAAAAKLCDQGGRDGDRR